MWNILFGWLGKKAIETVAEKAVDSVTSTVDTATKQPDNSRAEGFGPSHLQYTTFASHNTWLDVLVDGVGRAIRPGITIWLFGGLAGAWKLPSPNEIDPVMFELTMWVMGFWFGSRAIAKDLPLMIGSILKVVRSP